MAVFLHHVASVHGVYLDFSKLDCVPAVIIPYLLGAIHCSLLRCHYSDFVWTILCSFILNIF
jgi:hypothetical protein